MKVILKESGLYQETTELLDFNTSGSLKTHGAVASSGSITAGTLVSTGSLTVGGGYGSTGLSVTNAGNLSMDGVLTVDSTSTLTGDVTFGGHIVADADEAKNIFAAVTTAGNAITIGGGGVVATGGDLKVGGNDILAGDGTTALTLAGSTGDVATNGHLKVGNNVIKAASGTTAITLANSGDATVAGDLTVSGNDLDFGNGATIVNTDASTLTITEALVSVAGALSTTGNASVSGSMHILGDLDVAGAINSVTKTTSILEVEDLNIIMASGSSASDADGGGIIIGGYAATGGTAAASVLWDNGNSALDFNIGSTTEMRLEDGVLRPETDNDVDLGASGAEFKDLYLDGVAYIDDLRADALGAALNCASQAMTNVNVDSGVIDGTVIGGASAAAGSFTTVAASSTVTSAGRMICDDTTEATTTTNGSLQTDGGLSVAKSAVIGDDLDLLSDGAIMNIGSTSKFTLTALDANNAVAVTANHRLAFGDAGEYIAGDGTDLKIVSSGDVDITGDTDVVGGLSSTQATTLASAAGVTTIGSSNAAVFSADGALAINSTTDSTAATNGSLQTDGGLGVAKDAVFGNDVKLLSDDAVLSFGADSDTTLTHTDGTGLTMNSGNKLCFRAASQYIYSSNANMLALGAASMISLNASSHNFMGANGTDVDTIVRINGATTSYGLNLPNTSTTGDAIANSWSTYSDATLKKDITPIENALEKVMSMKGVSYEYKSGGGRKVGFLAQDMKSVVPEVVKSMPQGDDKDLLCISYDQLTSVLVEAVKAQQAQIEDLKSEVVKLSDNS